MLQQQIDIEICKRIIEREQDLLNRENSNIQTSFAIKYQEELLEIGRKILGKEEEFNLLPYSKKLEFWDSNGLNSEIEFYNVVESGNQDEIKNGIYNGEKFSISPKTPEEQKLQFEWFCNYLKNKYWFGFNIDRMKERHHAVLNESPDPVLYVQNELERLQRITDLRFANAEKDYKRYFGLNITTVYQSYKRANESEVKRLDLEIYSSEGLTHFEQLLAGKVDAHYIPFLKNELKRLEENKQPIAPIIEESEEVTNKIQEKIVWLHKTGVIDAIKSLYNAELQSNTTLAKFLSYGMTRPEEMRGELWDSIKKALERIDENKDKLYLRHKEYIDEKLKGLRMNKVS